MTRRSGRHDAQSTAQGSFPDEARPAHRDERNARATAERSRRTGRPPDPKTQQKTAKWLRVTENGPFTEGDFCCKAATSLATLTLAGVTSISHSRVGAVRRMKDEIRDTDPTA